MNAYGTTTFTTAQQKCIQILQAINAQLMCNIHEGTRHNSFVITLPLKCCIITATCRDGNFVLPLYARVGGKHPHSSLKQV